MDTERIIRKLRKGNFDVTFPPLTLIDGHGIQLTIDGGLILNIYRNDNWLVQGSGPLDLKKRLAEYLITKLGWRRPKNPIQ